MFRAGGRSENPEGWGTGSYVLGIICPPPWFELGLTDLPKYGWGGRQLPCPFSVSVPDVGIKLKLLEEGF